MAAQLIVEAARVSMMTQQNRRGISRGDVVELPNKKLGKVLGKGKPPGTLRVSILSSTRAGVDKAASAFGRFKGRNANTADLVKMPKLSGEAWKLGELVGVIYQATHHTSGKPAKYLHKFGKSRPALAVCNDGKQLVILGGGYRVTDRGIVG